MTRKWIACAVLGVVFFLTICLPFASAGEKQAQPAPGLATGDVSVSPTQYIIGPEDVLSINVWKEDSITQTVPVRIDGNISLPLLDDIRAAGKTPLELKEIITEKLKGYIENPTVTVTVLEANSYKIFLTGEVKNPGVMRIRSPITLMKAITTAGGFTEWANKRKILIITRDEQGNEKRITVNYNRILDGDEPDPVITRGDTIVVR